jgi:hypothetical protein
VKLIEALIAAQQVFGKYGDWQATHATGCVIGLGPYGGMYFAYEDADKRGLLSQGERLETVIAGLAEKRPETIGDTHWKVSRWMTKSATLTVNIPLASPGLTIGDFAQQVKQVNARPLVPLQEILRQMQEE